MMYPTLDDYPFWFVYGYLFLVVLLRAQATYWIGRGVAAGVLKSRFGKKLEGPQMVKARRTIDRWGAPAISASFLTVGFQTVINMCAGFIRMNYLRYTLAMLVGCSAWALVYTLGATAIFAWVGVLLESPWIGAGIAVAVAALVTTVVVFRRRRREGAKQCVDGQLANDQEPAGFVEMQK